MRISDQLRRRVIAYVVTQGSPPECAAEHKETRALCSCPPGLGTYEARVEDVSRALGFEARPFRDWVNLTAGDTLAVTEGKILVTVVGRTLLQGVEWLRVRHPLCCGSGCPECREGAVNWAFAPGELQALPEAS